MHMTTTHLSIKFGHIFIQSGYIDIFLSRVSILTRDINIANLSVCLSICPSVHPSVTFRYCMKTAYRIVIVFFHNTVAQSF